MYVNNEEKSKLIWQPRDPVVLLWESLKSIHEQSFNLFLSRSSQMSGVSSISPELQFSEMDIYINQLVATYLDRVMVYNDGFGAFALISLKIWRLPQRKCASKVYHPRASHVSLRLYVLEWLLSWHTFANLLITSCQKLSKQIAWFTSTRDNERMSVTDLRQTKSITSFSGEISCNMGMMKMNSESTIFSQNSITVKSLMPRAKSFSLDTRSSESINRDNSKMFQDSDSLKMSSSLDSEKVT